MNRLPALLFFCGIALASPNSDLDLPVCKPEPGPPPRISIHDPAPAPSPPIDDPRDTPPPVFFGEEIPLERDALCFVVDASGSMEGVKWERAKAELCRCILSLVPSIRFNVYAYDCTYSRWVSQLSSDKAGAFAWIAPMPPRGGGTNTGGTMGVALGSHPECLTYVLLTDGSPNCGAGPSGATFEDMPRPMNMNPSYHVLWCHREWIRRHNGQHAKINVFGIEASGMFRQFCQEVAGDSGGLYMDVP